MSTPDPWSGDRLAAVAVGAAVGALARVGVGQWLPTHGHELPVATLLVNLLGCLLIGLLTPFLRGRHPLLSLGLSTGVLGGFTTFSAFALDIEKLARPAPDTMIVYFLATTIGCVVAAATGLVVAERIVDPAEPEVHQRGHGHASPISAPERRLLPRRRERGDR